MEKKDLEDMKMTNKEVRILNEEETSQINKIVKEFKKHGVDVEQIDRLESDLYIVIEGYSFRINAMGTSPSRIVKSSLKHLKLVGIC